MKLDSITNKAERIGQINPNDEFYTPIYAVTPIVKRLRPNSAVWCPFDSERSNFVIELRRAGHNVCCSHIGEGVDFFKSEPPAGCDYIISNPPYSMKFEVFDRLFSLGIPFAMLVGVVGLFESSKRFNLFKNNKFEVLYFDKRISYFKSYDDQKPSLNPPFSSVYICNNILSSPIEFEAINKSK